MTDIFSNLAKGAGSLGKGALDLGYNVGKGALDIGKGALMTIPRYRKSFQSMEASDLQLETAKMERWLKIAKDPSYSRQLRVNSFMKAFDTQAGKALLNRSGIENSQQWAEESIDRIDQQVIQPRELMGNANRWSYSPSTGVRLFGGGEDYDRGDWQLLAQLESERQGLIDKKSQRATDLDQQINFIRSKVNNQMNPSRGWSGGLGNNMMGNTPVNQGMPVVNPPVQKTPNELVGPPAPAYDEEYYKKTTTPEQRLKNKVSYATTMPDEAANSYRDAITKKGGTDKDIEDLKKIFREGNQQKITEAIRRLGIY